MYRLVVVLCAYFAVVSETEIEPTLRGFMYEVGVGVEKPIKQINK